MIDLNRVRTFLTVAQAGNMRKAAAQLFITQPAVSHQIKLLEEELGFLLFSRVGRGLVLTPEGRRIAERAEHLIQGLESEVFGTQKRKKTLSGLVRIAALSDYANLLLFPKVKRFLAKHPDLEIHWDFGSSWDVEQAVRGMQADLGLVARLRSNEGLTLTPFQSVPHQLYVERKFQGTEAPLMDCKIDFPLISAWAKANPRFDLGIDERRPSLLISTLYGVRDAIEQGMGAGVLPVFSATRKMRPLRSGAKTFEVELQVIRKASSASPLVAALIEEL